MGIFDRAKDSLTGHSEQSDTGVEKAGDFVDKQTEDRYAERLDEGQDAAGDKLAASTADEPDQPV
jgi:hypothetical protein